MNGQPILQWLKDNGCPVGYVRLRDCPEIQTPVNRIADLISSMTIYLMENGELGNVRVTNEFSRMVDITPNKYANHKEFYYAIVKNMLLNDGNAIVYPKHSKGMLVDMIPFNMGKTSIIPDSGGYGYYIEYEGRTYQPDEVLHFRANPDENRPWLGTGYRVLLKDIAHNLAQAQKTKKTFMENPAPSIIVRVDGLVDEFDSAEGREKLRDKYITDTDGGKPWIIPADLIDISEIKPLSLNDIAINDSVMLDKKTAAAIFGVPPYMVGAGDFSKDEYNAFVNSVIHPMAKSIQQELTRKLVYGDKWFFQFNSRSLYAYDLAELINAGKEMVDRIAMDRNEWRDWAGLSPREDMIPLLGLENYIPAEALGKQKKLVGAGGNITLLGDDAATIGGQTINVQQLNGITKIIEYVIDGTYSQEAAIKLFKLAFPTISEDDAKSIISGAAVPLGGES